MRVCTRSCGIFYPAVDIYARNSALLYIVGISKRKGKKRYKRYMMYINLEVRLLVTPPTPKTFLLEVSPQIFFITNLVAIIAL